jgi:hypothetical protein
MLAESQKMDAYSCRKYLSLFNVELLPGIHGRFLTIWAFQIKKQATAVINSQLLKTLSGAGKPL